MKKALLPLAAAMVSQLSLAASWPAPEFPVPPNPATLSAQCKVDLAKARKGIAKMEKRAPDGRWLAAYDNLNAAIEDAYGPVDLLPNVHPDKAMREAAEQCAQQWQDLLSTMGQDEKLFRAAKRVKPKDAIDAELLDTTIKSFQDSGVSLKGKARARAKVINDKLNDLRLAFDKNIRDAAIRVSFTEAELKGVPEAVWKDAKRDEQGRIVLGVDYPSYGPVLQAAELASTRERMWRAKINEGGEPNLKLLSEMAQLRKEYAQLFGFNSYADFVLRRRMAQNTARTMAFLDDVKAAVKERELQEVADLAQLKAKHLGTAESQTRIERWDLAFYSERLRKERYSVDQEAFRAYFPPEESLKFALRLIEKLMGVKYTQIPGPAPWHADTKRYEVSDATSGKPLAGLIVDLYPRDGKYNHAAVWSYRSGSTRMGRLPQAALVVNFDRKGLTLDELETLLHELGHSVHSNLSATRYSLQAGTSVLHDFVEAPSQMLEEWVYDPQVQKLFAEVCPTCTPVPPQLLAKARESKDFPKGVGYARQHLYASFDMALHAADAPDPMALWAKLEGATPIGYVPSSMFPAGFSHLAGGYAAGYYGYLWSLVVAMDMRTAFEADRLDPKVGKRYRDVVLGNGSQRRPQELVKEFLGRETNSKAFFNYLKK